MLIGMDKENCFDLLLSEVYIIFTVRDSVICCASCLHIF